MKIQNSRCKIQGPDRALRTPHSAFRNRGERGFTYIALLAAIIILGISLGAAGKYWSNVMYREKEEELLFRGDQYVEAIKLFSKGSGRTPSNIEDLLHDRLRGNRPFLRKKYKDPITGEDFVEIFSVNQNGVRQLIGVRSSSDKEPLKQSNFPAGPNDPPYLKDFEGKKKYSEWLFGAKKP